MQKLKKDNIAIIIAVLLIAAYIIFQFYTVSHIEIETQIATLSTVYEKIDATALVLRDEHAVESTGGGVTFSGGEPLMQWTFIKETIGLLGGVHTIAETSGHVPQDVFVDALNTLSMVIMDIKHMDSAQHAYWTGQGNERILANAKLLLESDTPCIIRVPLIPGVNDSAENLEAAAQFVCGAKNLMRVELLPYHQTAGAKYEMAGMQYAPGFETDRQPNADTSAFERRGVPVKVL